MGSLKPKKEAQEVQNDFYLATAADIVADPSAPEAFVNGVMEGKEWVWDNGIVREEVVSNYKKHLTETKLSDLEEKKLAVFDRFAHPAGPSDPCFLDFSLLE